MKGRKGVLMGRIACFALAIMAVAVNVYAARPLDTDDAGTVEPGKYEVDLGYDHINHNPDGICQSPGFQLKHGLSARMDIGVAFGHETWKDAEGSTVSWGTTPLAVGLKAALLREHKLLPDFSLSAGFETGSNAWGLNAIASREISGLGLHLNLGYNGSGVALERGSYGFGLAAEYPLFEKLRLCAELNSELLDDGHEVLGNSGLVGGSIDLGFGSWDLGGRLFDKRGPRWQAVTGLTIGF
jgi:hypothetical protein